MLGIEPGATILLDKDGFRRLAEAFLGRARAALLLIGRAGAGVPARTGSGARPARGTIVSR